MGGGNSKNSDSNPNSKPSDPDGIDGVQEYWVHVGAMTALEGEYAVPPAHDQEWDGYVVTRWRGEDGKVLKNARGHSAFERHGNYQHLSHKVGALYDDLMEFRSLYTKRTSIEFSLHQKFDGLKGMWDYSDPIAIAQPTKSLMQMEADGLLGKQQTVDFIVNHPKKARIGFRLEFTVGDSSVEKPTTQSEVGHDMGNGPVTMIKDENGDGEITMEDTKPQKAPPLRSATTNNLAHREHVAGEHPDDDV